MPKLRLADEELKNTTNVLRVEIQCKKNKLKRIEKKNNKLIDFNTSYNFILNDIERNFKTGSCYKFKYFKETVIPYLFKSRTKQQNAINLLQYTFIIFFSSDKNRSSLESQFINNF